MRSDSESAVSGVLEVMSSFVAKGMSLDGALHALCLNFKLYVQEKFGANAGRGGLYIRQMNRTVICVVRESGFNGKVDVADATGSVHVNRARRFAVGVVDIGAVILF